MATARKTTPVVAEAADTFTPTAEEIEALRALRAKRAAEPVSPATEPQVGMSELANALVTAIRATQPPAKKTTFTRHKGDPWQNADGSPKPKLKRPLFQHAIEVNEDQLKSEQIELANKLKPGKYCDGHIRVIKRRDGALDIDYPIKTVAQRLKIVNQFGITNFTTLLQRLVDERANPTKYRRPDEDDDE